MSFDSASVDSALILVVDDDPVMRLLMRESLEQGGLSVQLAQDGVEALSLLTALTPDLVLLDVKMPRLDGFEVCRRMRAQEEWEEIPIVMVTGLEDTPSIEQAYQAGATDFITKPVVWSTLSHRVRYLLRASRALRALKRNEVRLTQAQRVARVGNWDWDLVHDRLYWSDEIYRIFGLEPDVFELTHQRFLGRVHEDDRTPVETAIDDALQRRKPYKIEYRIIHKDGDQHTVESQAEVVFGQGGLPVRMHGTIQDITERKQSEAQIRYLAYYDQLTGLPNRQLFRNHLEGALRLAQRDGTKLALIFLDLDQFKVINDTLGHNAGDELLRNVAQYLKQTLRASDLVAKLEPAQPSPEDMSLSRLGGDEFTILLPALKGVEMATHVCRRILDHLCRPMQIEGATLSITGSMGVAIYPDDGEDADTLLKHSDIAMYQAKQRGKNNFCFFERSMHERVGQHLDPDETGLLFTHEDAN